MERRCQLQPATLPVDNNGGFKIPRPRPIQKSVADQDPDVGCSEDVDEQVQLERLVEVYFTHPLGTGLARVKDGPGPVMVSDTLCPAVQVYS